MSCSCLIFLVIPLKIKYICIAFSLEGLFVLRPVADLDFVSVFNHCAWHKKKITSTLNDVIYYFFQKEVPKMDKISTSL
jgi:hypothetical protein